MDHEDLKNIISEIFIPLGFKQKNNNWVKNGLEINKIVNLQRSSYGGNNYYVNYGFVIVGLPLKLVRMHLERRLVSNNQYEQKKITELLSLDLNMEVNYRTYELKKLLNGLAEKMNEINTIEELKQQIIEDKVEVLLPKVVLDYLNIKITSPLNPLQETQRIKTHKDNY